MIFTNNYDLPEPLVKVLSYDDYDPTGDISVTGLIGPPQIRQLMLKHGDDITVDVMDRVWLMLGNAVHAYLEMAAKGCYETVSEKRVTHLLHGYEISGKADLLEKGLTTLSDYKVTSAYSFLRGVKPEWEAQLNLYNFLYNLSDYKSIEELKVYAILRDWSKTKSRQGDNYPPRPIMPYSVGMWTKETTNTYLKTRTEIHQAADKGNIILCTDDERWHKDDKYAVKKRGVKRAYRLLNTEAEAIKMMENMGTDYEFEFRPGEDTRCLDYCDASKYCPQLNPTLKGELTNV